MTISSTTIVISATGRMYAHDLPTLHAFADQLGVAERWRQPPSVKFPHYDLSDDEPLIRKALSAGAVPACQSSIIAVANQARRRLELKPEQGRRS